VRSIRRRDDVSDMWHGAPRGRPRCLLNRRYVLPSLVVAWAVPAVQRIKNLDIRTSGGIKYLLHMRNTTVCFDNALQSIPHLAPPEMKSLYGSTAPARLCPCRMAWDPHRARRRTTGRRRTRQQRHRHKAFRLTTYRVIPSHPRLQQAGPDLARAARPGSRPPRVTLRRSLLRMAHRQAPRGGPPTVPARRLRSESAAAVAVSLRRRRPRRQPVPE
jgi:hypothetical protein